MVTVHIHSFDNLAMDRTGITDSSGRQGFRITIEDFNIEFDDELDAELIARKILFRLGVDVPDRVNQ